MKLFLPKYLQHNQLDELYTRLSKLPPDNTLTLSFEQCVWADHFELQKLAVQLAGLPPRIKSLTIYCYSDNPSNITDDLTDITNRTIDVIDYANRIHFFLLLHSRFGEQLTLICGDKSISALTQTELQGQLAEVLPVRRADTHQSRSYIPIQSLNDHSSVDRITKSFLTGAQIQELVEHHAGLDFVSSGEFATLVVHELLQNTIEHAWPQDYGNRIAVVSLCTVASKRRDNYVPKRLEARSQYGPPYEQQFLENLLGPGYLELCVSDNGVGIVSTLKASSDSWSTWFGKAYTPTDADLLASAFWANVTRDAGPHRPGHRGLYFVFESVRENSGVVVCQTGDKQISLICNDPEWLEQYSLRPELTPTNAQDVVSIVPAVQGTHLRVLLPLSGKTRTRRFWHLRFASQTDALTPPENGLNFAVEAAPRPPTPDQMQADVIGAMKEFREQCREVVNRAQPSIAGFEGSILWLSAAHTRFWRKQHIQTLLTEILSKPSLTVVSIVNLPSNQFQPFLFVARYVTAIETGKIIFLLDESGKRTCIYRQYSKLYENFMRWGAEGGDFILDSTPESDLLSAFTNAFAKQYPGVSLTRLQFAAMTLGIQVEFETLLEGFRDITRVVRIDNDCLVQGYIELDEALRDASFLRAVASLVRLSRRFLIKPKGTVVVRRAAARLIEHYGPLDDQDIWIMPTPNIENAPSAEWLSNHMPLCIITDVVCRGKTLLTLLSNIGISKHFGPHHYPLTIVAPLIMDLETLGELSTIRNIIHTTMPGLSYLISEEEMSIPVVWAMRSTAKLQDRQVTYSVPVPDRTTNILFEGPAGLQSDTSMGEMEPGAFIRFAEHQNAIWLGHLTITGEHFDLEFNMSRLLREDSNILVRYVDMVLRSIEAINADTILYPDESRIQLAVPAIEDALHLSGKTVPKVIRLRRSASGELFLRKVDEATLREAKAIVLIDDAVNSGGTARQMLSKAAEFAPQNAVFCFCIVVSRQRPDDERLFYHITGIQGRKFTYKSLVRIPVTFFSETNCPYCRVRDVARSLAIGLGTRSQVCALIREFADDLEADKAYTRTVSRSLPEPSLRYFALSPTIEGVASEQFATLAGAKTAIACVLGSRPELNLNFFIEVLDQCRGQLNLAAYVFYAASSRASGERSFIDSPEFSSRFDHLCDALGDEARDGEGSIEAFTGAVVDLCLTCWFVGVPTRIKLIASIIRHCDKYLINTRVYEWVLFLAFGLSQEKELYQNEFELINRAIEEARHKEAQKEQTATSPLNSIERLMRIRQVAQALGGQTVSEPWLEGVVKTLERLSYKAGHEWLDYVNRRDVGWARSLGQTFNNILENDDEANSNNNRDEITEAWSELDTFLKRPNSTINFLAKGLNHSLGSWLKAVNYVEELSSPLDKLLDKISNVEIQSSNLLEALDEARAAYRYRKLELLPNIIAKIAEIQNTLYMLLYDQSAHQTVSLRIEIERLLCPVYDLAGPFSYKEVEKDLQEHSFDVHARGSFFDYCEQVKNQQDTGTRPRWSVLLAPAMLVEAILRDVIIENPKKHILKSIPQNSKVEILVDIEGLESLDHRTRFRIGVLVNGTKWGLPKELWHKTLGRNREILLHVYGGNARVETSEHGHDNTVVVEFLSGHF